MIDSELAEESCFPWFDQNLPGSIWNKKCLKENLDHLLILNIFGVGHLYFCI